MLQTREQLLNNFDEDVHARLNVHLDESKKQLDKFEKENEIFENFKSKKYLN